MSKLQEIIATVERSWGPLPVRDSSYALDQFNAALETILPDAYQRHFGRTIAGFVIQGLRERKIKSDGRVALDDITSILRSHIEKGSNLYVFTSYFIQHAPDDFCEGSERDYRDYFAAEWSEVHTDFLRAKDLAAAYVLDELIETIPDASTGAYLKLDIFDGDHLIQMGRWNWERNYGWLIWDDAERH